MKGNCRKKNLTTSERKISAYTALEISQNSQENTCARVSFLIKLQAKFLRTPFFIEHIWWLLLVITTLLLNKIYSLEKIRIWWNGNFLSLIDFLFNLTSDLRQTSLGFVLASAIVLLLVTKWLTELAAPLLSTFVTKIEANSKIPNAL